MTRRLRGDMRLFPRWSAPCAASLESSTASLVSGDVFNALLVCWLLKGMLKMQLRGEIANSTSKANYLTHCMIFV